MKQKVSGSVGVIIIVVAVVAAVVFGWSYMKDPSKVTPDDMRKNMAKGQQQMMEQAKKQQEMNRRGPMGQGGPGGPPAGVQGGYGRE